MAFWDEYPWILKLLSFVWISRNASPEMFGDCTQRPAPTITEGYNLGGNGPGW